VNTCNICETLKLHTENKAFDSVFFCARSETQNVPYDIYSIYIYIIYFKRISPYLFILLYTTHEKYELQIKICHGAQTSLDYMGQLVPMSKIILIYFILITLLVTIYVICTNNVSTIFWIIRS